MIDINQLSLCEIVVNHFFVRTRLIGKLNFSSGNKYELEVSSSFFCYYKESEEFYEESKNIRS